MQRANELGMSHISITDHGAMAGHRDFQQAAAEANITPILGLEAYISATDRFDKRANSKRSDGTSAYNHITLLSLNQNGYENLSKLSELAWSEGFYNKPRIDLDLLSDYSDDMVVLSGCLNGLICKSIENDDLDAARRIALHLKSVFNDRFFIEVQSHNPKAMNLALLELADSLKIQPVMASDCHYAREEDLWAEEAMLILSTNPKPEKGLDMSATKGMEMLDKFNYLYPDRKMTFQDYQLFLRSLEQEQNLFKAQGIDRTDIFDNTYEIANMVGDYAMYKGLSLLPEPKTDANARLRSLCNGGLKHRAWNSPEYLKRMELELGIIQSKDFASYFLVVADMIAWAKRNGIMVGPGRGSAAGSLVCYLLGITEIDPLEHNLLFARFINEERNDWPDIDIDLMDTRRNEVKEYLTRKFKHVASISTFTYFKDKGVVRDASRVLGVPLSDVNKVLKTIDTYDDFTNGSESRWFRDQYPDVQKIANYLRGRIRSVGMHAAGIIVSKEPINKYAPIETRRDTSSDVSGRIPVVAYDMGTAEDVGLIKIDLLGLKTLSVIDMTVKTIKERRGIDINLLSIDMEDAAVYTDLSNGFTRGVFQCEAAPYTNLLERMGIDSFAQLVASNALVRPGAMNTVGGDYIARKQGRASVTSVHPIYDEITKDSYGLCLPETQKVLTVNGRKSIKDVVAGDMVMGESGKIGPVVKSWNSGEKEVFDFSTERGVNIQSTADHRVLTSNGYMPIMDAYESNSFICINRNSYEGVLSHRTWEPTILAGLIAEGHLSSHSTYTFCNNDEEILTKYESAAKHIFNISPRRYFNTRAWYISLSQTDRFRAGYHSPSEVAKYIRSLDLEDMDSYSKFIPDLVFGWSIEARLEFLGFYISCDGYISNDCVKITTVSEQLAKDIYELLNSVGILSKIHKRNTGAYDVFIKDFDAYRALLAKYIVGSKRKIVVSAKSTLGPAPKTVRSLWLDSGISQHTFSSNHGFARSSLSPRSNTTLSTLELVEGGHEYFYTRLTGVKSVGIKSVYDIEVLGTNSFITSGLVVHNCIYQEQVMQLCNQLGGMSWSDADKIRKIIGKKKDVHEFDQYRERFVAGASQHITEETAEKIWHTFEAHASYSFNKSHAVAYSTLSYWSAWLKHYYPLEFMLSILVNEKDKETRTDYLIEAKRIGIKVLLPHVNSSSVGFTIDGDAIRFGLSDIKYLSEKLAPRVLNLGPFTSYRDVREKTLQTGTGINSRAIDSMDKVGALEFPDNPLRGDEKDYYYEYLNIPQFTPLGGDEITTMVLKNLDDITDFDEKENFIFYAMVKSIKRGKGWSRVELVDKTGSVGVFHTEHTQIMAGKMYLMLVGNNRIFRYIDLEDIKELDNDPFIRYCRSDELKIPHDKKVVIAFSTRMTRANKHMGTVILSDKEKKLYTASVWPKNYGRALGKLQPGMVVDVSLRQMDDGTLFVQKIN